MARAQPLAAFIRVQAPPPPSFPPRPSPSSPAPPHSARRIQQQAKKAGLASAFFVDQSHSRPFLTVGTTNAPCPIHATYLFLSHGWDTTNLKRVPRFPGAWGPGRPQTSCAKRVRLDSQSPHRRGRTIESRDDQGDF